LSDEGQTADLEPWTQAQLTAFVDAVFRVMMQRLVSEPVEPVGILSRIEMHVTKLRDFLHGAMQDPIPPDGVLAIRVLQQEIRSIADHDAHISAARHEFLREFLVALRNDVTSKLDSLQKAVSFLEVDAPALINRLERIEARLK